MSKENVRAMLVIPHKHIEETFIGTSLEELQQAVDGFIELVPDEHGCHILCNEEGKIRGFEPNRIYGSDVLVGTFLIVRIDDEGEFVSVTDDDITTYREIFDEPMTEEETAYWRSALSWFTK